MSAGKPGSLLDSPSPAWPIALIAANFAATLAVAFGAFELFPFSSDEYVYLFSAEHFSRGRLSVGAPAPPEFFRTHGVLFDEHRAYGKYPPGWPALLVPGILAGLPWLVNPLLTALTWAVAWRISLEQFGARAANLLLLFILFNPFIVLNGASYFSHPAGLLFLTLCLWACVRCAREPGNRSAWLALGASAGAAFLVRPFTAVVFVGASVLCLMTLLDRNALRRFAGPGILAASAPFLACVGLLLAYNARLTGSPWLQPFTKYEPSDTAIEWLRGAEAWGGRLRSHGRERFLALVTWAPAVPLAFLLGTSSEPLRATAFFRIGPPTFLAVYVAYFFCRWDGWIQYGPRYLFETLSALLIAAAAGAARVGRFTPWIAATVVVLNLWVLARETPSFAAQLRRRGDVERQARDAGLNRAIIFMSEAPEGSTVEDCARNGPGFDRPLLIVRDLGRRNQDLLDRYSDRAPYLYRRDESGRLRLEPIRGK